jgi:hypothetical protein
VAGSGGRSSSSPRETSTAWPWLALGMKQWPPPWTSGELCRPLKPGGYLRYRIRCNTGKKEMDRAKTSGSKSYRTVMTPLYSQSRVMTPALFFCIARNRKYCMYILSCIARSRDSALCCLERSQHCTVLLEAVLRSRKRIKNLILHCASQGAGAGAASFSDSSNTCSE